MNEEYHQFTYQAITQILSGINLKTAFKNIKQATNINSHN